MKQMTTLCRMIELRRRKDPVLRREPPPSDWPTFQLWRTPEYIIYSMASYVALLKRDGLTEPDALAHIDAVLGLHVLPPGQKPTTLAEYLPLVLTRHHPDYLRHAAELLDSTITLAQKQIEGVPPQRSGSYPPDDWLGSRIEPKSFREEYAERLSSPDLLFPTSTFDADLVEFLVRWQEGDELRSFTSPAVTWQLMMGSAGVALVRGGRPIAHLLTLMN